MAAISSHFSMYSLEGKQHHPAGGSLVPLIGLDPAVVDGELFEVGQDGERQLGRPGITAQLEGGMDI